MPKTRTPLNPWQKKFLEVYANGDYRHLRDGTYEEARDEIQGDTLAQFLLIELSTPEGCTDSETAYWRMENAMQDVQKVFLAIEDMQPEEDDEEEEDADADV